MMPAGTREGVAASRKVRYSVHGDSAVVQRRREKMGGLMEAVSVDGRSGRSVRTREKIIFALFDLIREGNLRPRGEEIAERAEVAVRTLFRHFDDMESLFASAQAIVSERMDVDGPLPDVRGDLEERCRAYATEQAGIFTENRNYLLFYTARVRTEAEANAIRTASAKTARLRLWSALPECAAAPPPIRRAVEELFSFQSWDQLRFEQSLSHEDAVDTIVFSAHLLLKAASPASGA